MWPIEDHVWRPAGCDWQYKWIKLGLERPHTVFIFCRTFHAPRNFASIPKNPPKPPPLRSRVGQCAKPAAAPEAADWIIIGGGASGCAAAAALADAGEDVLVLERGQSDLDGGPWGGELNELGIQLMQIYSPMDISMCEMRGEWARELCPVGTTSVVSRSLTFPNRWKLIQEGQPSNIVDRWFCGLEHEGYQHLSGSLLFCLG